MSNLCVPPSDLEAWAVHDFVLTHDNQDHSRWVCRLCGEVEWRITT